MITVPLMRKLLAAATASRPSAVVDPGVTEMGFHAPGGYVVKVTYRGGEFERLDAVYRRSDGATWFPWADPITKQAKELLAAWKPPVVFPEEV